MFWSFKNNFVNLIKQRFSRFYSKNVHNETQAWQTVFKIKKY